MSNNLVSSTKVTNNKWN